MTVRVIANPENVDTHDAVRIVIRPSLKMDPQVGSGGCTPMPRKLRAASMISAKAKFKVARTITGVITFGRM